MAELITLARPYAKAAFEFASEHNSTDEWSQMLNLIKVVGSDEVMKAVISNPSLTSDQKAAIFNEICGDRLNESARNFVRLVAENHRLDLVGPIADLFEQLKRQQDKSVDVDIVSAFDMEDAQQNALAEALTKKLERKVNIKVSTDKSIIGGVIVHAGDQVIDASIRGRLLKLAEAINS